MSRTLTLIQTGWESIRAAAARGQKADALRQLERLVARPDVPADVLRDGCRLAAELALDVGKFGSARRHAKTAMALDPTDARAKYLAGRAWEEDTDGCDRRAAIAYRAASRLDEANPLYRAAFGRAAARCGKLRRGTREMLAAADQAPGDLGVVGVVVRGLLELERPAAARRVLEKAHFLNPRSAELAALRERVRFETARTIQKRTQRTTRQAQDAQFARDGDRVLLPFVRIAGGAAPRRDAAMARTDVVSFPRPHLGGLRRGKVDR